MLFCPILIDCFPIQTQTSWNFSVSLVLLSSSRCRLTHLLLKCVLDSRCHFSSKEQNSSYLEHQSKLWSLLLVVCPKQRKFLEYYTTKPLKVFTVLLLTIPSPRLPPPPPTPRGSKNWENLGVKEWISDTKTKSFPNRKLQCPAQEDSSTRS